MLADALSVLTCSNLTCPTAPRWYDLSENWAAHLGLGALLGRFLHSRWAGAVLALLLLKEGALDIPGDPRLSVIMDSLLDLAATALGLWGFSPPSR